MMHTLNAIMNFGGKHMAKKGLIIGGGILVAAIAGLFLSKDKVPKIIPFIPGLPPEEQEPPPGQNIVPTGKTPIVVYGKTVGYIDYTPMGWVPIFFHDATQAEILAGTQWFDSVLHTLTPPEPEPEPDPGPWYGTYTVSGRVLDKSGKPVQGASVTVFHDFRSPISFGRAWIATTDDNGYYSIANIIIPYASESYEYNLQVRAYKPGWKYVDVRRSIKSSQYTDGQIPQNFTLTEMEYYLRIISAQRAAPTTLYIDGQPFPVTTYIDVTVEVLGLPTGFEFWLTSDETIFSKTTFSLAPGEHTLRLMPTWYNISASREVNVEIYWMNVWGSKTFTYITL